MQNNRKWYLLQDRVKCGLRNHHLQISLFEWKKMLGLFTVSFNVTLVDCSAWFGVLQRLFSYFSLLLYLLLVLFLVSLDTLSISYCLYYISLFSSQECEPGRNPIVNCSKITSNNTVTHCQRPGNNVASYGVDRFRFRENVHCRAWKKVRLRIRRIHFHNNSASTQIYKGVIRIDN